MSRNSLKNKNSMNKNKNFNKKNSFLFSRITEMLQNLSNESNDENIFVAN